MPPFLCLASSVTPKDADSAALEPQLTALHPISWGLPPGTLGSLRPTCPGEGAVTAVELREQGTGGGALPCWGGHLPAGQHPTLLILPSSLRFFRITQASGSSGLMSGDTSRAFRKPTAANQCPPWRGSRAESGRETDYL